MFDFYLAPSLIFPVAVPSKSGSWRVPEVFSSAIVYKTEIKNYKPGRQSVLAAVLSKEMGKGLCEGNSLPMREGEAMAGGSLIHLNTLEHQ